MLYRHGHYRNGDRSMVNQPREVEIGGFSLVLIGI